MIMKCTQWRSLLTGMAVLASGVACAAPVETELLGDRWYYPFSGDGLETYGRMFNYVHDPSSPGHPDPWLFNFRDSYVILKFGVELPAGISPDEYWVTAARIVVWNVINANWDPSVTETYAFAAGFGPTYTEAGWTEGSLFVGGLPTVHLPRDPYPRDLLDDSHVEDNRLTATPWATGAFPDYTVTGGTPGPFLITYELDVWNERVQSELKADLTSGLSSWILSTNLEQGDDTSQDYPSVYTRNNGSFVPPAPATFPQLIIEVQSTSAVADWSVY